MTIAPLPPAELTATAIRLLVQEIGIVNTARFINQFTMGYGNYTLERDKLNEGLTVADIAAAIRRDKNKGHLQ